MNDALIYSQVSDHGAYAELHQMLPSQIPAISPALDQTLDFLAKRRKADGSEIEIEVALGEAIANAVLHGNRERAGKCVSVVCRCTNDGDVTITVQDQGMGFESKHVPDPTIPNNRSSNSGRGIYLMRTLMDAVRFEREGTVVHMVKRSNARSVVEWNAR